MNISSVFNEFALNCTMKGCVISSANEGGYHRVFILSPVPQKRDSHINSHSLHDPVQDCGISIANALEI